MLMSSVRMAAVPSTMLFLVSIFVISGIQTPQCQIKGRHVAVVKLFLSHGCDINQPDLEGTSPLHGAAQVRNQSSK